MQQESLIPAGQTYHNIILTMVISTKLKTTFRLPKNKILHACQKVSHLPHTFHFKTVVNLIAIETLPFPDKGNVI